MLLFIRDAIEGAKISEAIFKILGPRPSRPVAFAGSSECMNSDTCCIVICGTVK